MTSSRPRVVVHSLASLDGRLDGFPPDLGLYYEVAAALPQDAVLTTSATLLAAARAEGVSLTGDEVAPPAPRAEPAEPERDARLPWLVVVDSRGQLTRLDWLRDQPYWSDVLVVCSQQAPPEHLAHLDRLGVEHLVVGQERVDLAEALRELRERYAVEAVRVDAGGTLSGSLLRAGLVDEVSVIVAPHLLGTRAGQRVQLVEGLDEGSPCALRLLGVTELRDDHVHLRYAVTDGG